MSDASSSDAPNSGAPNPDSKSAAVNETVEIIKTVAYALLIALALRVLLFQPYTIPSASMEPNLYRGDYIIVSKYSYGYSKHSIPLSPPLFHGRIFNHAPSRGDIIVFKYPREAATKREDFIKRLVGLPGDRIQLKDGVVFINGQALPRSPLGQIQGHPGGDGPDDPMIAMDKLQETASNGRKYVIQKVPSGSQADNTGVYVVPPHCYFMMGDNRDDSLDSRFDPDMPSDLTGSATCPWDPALDAFLGSNGENEAGVGFVPEEDLVGRARIVLLSWKPGASLFEPWTWLNLRWNRFFHGLQ
jgi:signal peptidase I